MKKGWIKLYRKMEEWDWYTDPPTCRLFTHMLIKANIETKTWRGISVRRGEFISGRKQLAKETGLSEQNIRTSIKKLKSTSELTIKTTNKYSLFKLKNYNLYQDTNQPSNQQLTSNQPTTNQQLTTTKEDNNIITKELKNIYMSPQDFETFWKLYPNKKGRKKASDKFKKMDKSLLPTILQSLDKHKRSKQWRENSGQYIPYGSTWVNNESWLDDIQDTESSGGLVTIDGISMAVEEANRMIETKEILTRKVGARTEFYFNPNNNGINTSE